MKKLFYFLFAGSALIISACSGGAGDDGTNGQQGKGGIYYGGVFRMNEIEDFRDLYPLNVTEVTSERIDRQVYEGLVKLNQADLKIIPSLAETWTKNEDATVWTFTIRKGVFFHDDPCFPDGKGREMNAKDVKYCFDKLCESAPNNQGYFVTFRDRVKGANEYFESTKNKNPLPGGVSGVKVLDDYTVQITLNFPFAGFENILVEPYCWIFPHEAIDKYHEEMRSHCVGTGPFKVQNVQEGSVVFLEKNKNYWGTDEFGQKLPYLDGLKYTFIKEKKQELIEFRQRNLDMVYRLPTEEIDHILSDFNGAKEGNRPFDLQVVPAMNTYYYGMLTATAPFNDKRVRLAFACAIDRDKIVNYTLKGEGIPGTYGIIPPIDAFKTKGFDYDKFVGQKYDPDKARKYLSDAGYGPGKKPFPKITLQINTGGGDRNVLIAQAVQSMLKENLGIEVTIDPMPFPQHLQKLETGQTQFFRSAWQSDYPDPESFLTLFYGPNVPAKLEDRSTYNTTRYKNPRYDSLFNAAMREIDEKKRFELYMMADQAMIEDAPIIPIFYDENYRMVQSSVRNFPANAMEYRDFSKVYFVPEKKDEKK